MTEGQEASVEKALLRGQTLLMEAVQGLETQRSLTAQHQAALRLQVIAAQEHVLSLDQRLSQIVTSLAGERPIETNRLEGELMGLLLLLAETQRCLQELGQAIEHPASQVQATDPNPSREQAAVVPGSSSSSLLTPARLEAELRKLREQLFAMSILQERSTG